MKVFLSLFLGLIILSSQALAADDKTAIHTLDCKIETTLAPTLQSEDPPLSIDYTLCQTSLVEQQIVKFNNELKETPLAIKEKQDELNRLTSETPDISVPQKNLSDLELDLTNIQSTQLALQQTQNKINAEIDFYTNRPDTLRRNLTLLQQAISLENTSRTEEQRQLNDALFTLNNLKIQATNLELLLIPLIAEYNSLDSELTSFKLSNTASLIRAYQDQIQQQRKLETEKLLTESASTGTSKDDPESITLLIEQNKKLSKQLRDSTANNTSAENKLRILEQKLALLQQSYKVVQQQLLVNDSNLGIELRHFTERFAVSDESSNTKSRISEIRLENIELNQLSLDMDMYVPNTSGWSDDLQDDYEHLKITSSNLIKNLHKAYIGELDELSKVLSIEQQIKEQSEKGTSLLNEHLMWLPSVPMIDANWFSELTSSINTQVHYVLTGAKSLSNSPSEQWLPWLAITILSGFLSLYLIRYQRRHEKYWSLEIGHVVKDRFIRSIKLLFLAPLIALPIPLGVYTLSNKYLIIGNEHILFINNLFAISLCLFLSMKNWLRRPYGLFISHLDIPEEFCVRLKQLIVPLYFIGAPICWLLLYIDNTPSQELHSGFGRLLYLILTILVCYFWAALWKVSPHVSTNESTVSWWQNTKLWLTSLVSIHILLFIAGFFGYLLTGLIIMSVILAVTWVFFTAFTIYRLGVRWLLIAERRISFNKAKIRRSEILAAREKNEEVPPLEEDYLGVKSVSEQGIVLLKAICFAFMSVALWLLVKNYLPSVDVLDKVILWSNDYTTANGVISESISLANIITSTFIIGISILAAYNLPGLLELLILRHMNLTPGTGYAITTVTRYILIMVSVLAGASQLGVEWAKLQWLVAAMGVGLGFGLQEIVANFVSGIIILFEKPVRIGDTVTIGGVTGKVTKIKIRATTISDWDRKEVIIPNKTFVTDQLINWSLSDAITRVTINVGVAHGSDTEKVHQLILHCVKANPRVLKDPIPEVFFTTLGNSTLDFEMRFFVADISDRHPAIHEINQQINIYFEEQNISVAFPQLDVHLHKPKAIRDVSIER